MSATVGFTACMGVGRVSFNVATCEHLKFHGGVKTMVALQEVPFIGFNACMANTKKCALQYSVDAVGACMVVMSELS